jgi:hypothetical protein
MPRAQQVKRSPPVLVKNAEYFRDSNMICTIVASLGMSLIKLKLSLIEVKELMKNTDAVLLCDPTKSHEKVVVRRVVSSKSHFTAGSMLTIGSGKSESEFTARYVYQGITQTSVLFIRWDRTAASWIIADNLRGWFEATNSEVIGREYYGVDSKMRMSKKPTRIAIKNILFQVGIQPIRNERYRLGDVLKQIESLDGQK